jgi:hypothetical protein
MRWVIVLALCACAPGVIDPTARRDDAHQVTEAQAIEAILQHWRDEWEWLHPADEDHEDHIPWVAENEVKDSAETWARITVVPTASNQATMGLVRRFSRRGQIAVQLFARPNAGPGTLARLADDVRTIFEGRRISTAGIDEPVCTYAGSTNPTQADGAWSMCLVTIAFRYDQQRGAPNIPPVADFSVDVDFLTATFTDGSVDSDGTITAWAWDFGDDETSTEQHPTHVYEEAGDYTVTLVVTDNSNRTNTTTMEIEATDPPGEFILILGDSNGVGQGDLAHIDDGHTLDVAFASVQANTRYAVGLVDPPTWFDFATDDLQSRQPSGAAGFGVELTMGRELFWNGGYEPFIGKIAVSGSKTTHWNGFLGPYMTAYIDARILETGATLGGVVLSLGTNDANDATTAANFAANLTTLMATIRTAYGANIKVALIETPAACIETHTATVRTQALAYIASDPLSVLIPANDIPIPDGRHFEALGYASLGQRAAYKLIDLMGLDRYEVTGAVPEIVGYEVAQWGTGTASGAVAETPRAPAAAVHNDIELAIIETGNVDNAPMFTSAQGFTEIVAAAQSSDLAGNKQRHKVFQRAVTQTLLDANGGRMPSPTVTDTNSMIAAKIFTIRGPNGLPTVNAAGGAVNNAFNTTLNLTGVTTDADNCLVISIVTGYTVTAANFATPVNASLTSLTTEQSSTLTTSGSDRRILSVITGIKAVGGATGTTVITMDGSGVLAGATIAIAP